MQKLLCTFRADNIKKKNYFTSKIVNAHIILSPKKKAFGLYSKKKIK